VVQMTDGILAAIPASLRNPLLEEYQLIARNYIERRWSPAELSGGRFCEIVFTILDGHAKGTFASRPQKPANFVMACRGLEANSHVPRSFQVLIPRILPALYEIRNNRGVGHVGGDVDPNHMDAGAVLAMCSWVMAEFIRVFHSLPIGKAQELVDTIVERRHPLVWVGSEGKLVLNPKVQLKDQILLLLDSSAGRVPVEDLQSWCKYKDRGYFLRLLRKLQAERRLALTTNDSLVEILPPGSEYVERLFSKKGNV
jgi:hypothetical protein